jgi:hypothetical protein
MMAGTMKSYLIQTQPNYVCYVKFPHKLEETPSILRMNGLYKLDVPSLTCDTYLGVA